jgi:hypothetical protein
VQSAAPQARQADIVDSLTSACCPIVEADASAPAGMKNRGVSERLYSELRSGGREQTPAKRQSPLIGRTGNR